MSSPFIRTISTMCTDSYKYSIGLIAAGVMAMLLWGLWIFFGRVVLCETTLDARLEVHQASHPIQANIAGRIVRVNMFLDKRVAKGDVLIELDSEVDRLRLEEENKNRDDFLARLQAVEKEIQAEKQAMVLAVAEQQEAFKEGLAMSREQEVIASYTEDKLNRLEELKGEGLIAELDYLEAEAIAERNQAEMETLRIASSRLKRKGLKTEGDRRALIEGLQREATVLRGRLATTGTKINQLALIVNKHKIRAQVTGTVGEITQLAPGAYVKAGDYLAAIVPQGKLQVVANYQPAAAMGKIRPGQPAQIRLYGFPWIEYGSIEASVSRVASETRDGVVRVELEIQKNDSMRIPMQHGLPGEVIVEVEQVTPAALVLRSVGKTLFRPAADATLQSHRAAGH